MIKVHGVMTERLLLKERPYSADAAPVESVIRGDTVTISEEGRRKRIMGHVMASITGPDVKKTP